MRRVILGRQLTFQAEELIMTRVRMLARVAKLARILHAFQLYYWFSDRIQYLLRDRWRKPRLTELRERGAEKLAIFGIFQPKGLSVFVRRQLQYLHKLGFDIALCASHELNPEDRSFVQSYCRYLVSRDNFGRDFGSYKDAILSIGFDALVTYKRVLLINDSFFFPLGNTCRFEKEYLSAKADVIGLFENSSQIRHIQSFFLDISSAVMCSPETQAFWKRYKPYNSRYQAIFKGEVEFSSAVLYKVAKSICVLYSQEKIYQAIASSSLATITDPERINEIFANPYSFRRELEEPVLTIVRRLLEETNISHSFALVVVQLMGAPFIKRDLYYRRSYDLAQIYAALAGYCEGDLLDEIILEFRKRGTERNLSAWQAIQSFAGAR